MGTLPRLYSATRKMWTCRQVGRMHQCYLDGELDEDRLATVSGHLEHRCRCNIATPAFASRKASLAAIQRGGALPPGDRPAIARHHPFADHLSGSCRR